MTASGTGVSLAYINETTKGQLNSTVILVELPTISRNINLKKDLLESAAVTSTRQRLDVRHGFNRVEGELGVEMRMNTYDPLIASGIGATATSSWYAPTTVLGSDGTPDATLSATTIGTATGSSTTWFYPTAQITRGDGGNFVQDGYRPGDWVVLAGYTNATLNGRFRVVFVAASVLWITGDANTSPFGPVTSDTFGQSLDAGGVGTSITFLGTKINPGSNLPTFTIERKFQKVDSADLVDVYQVFLGCAVNSWSLSARPESLVTATFNILGISGNIDNRTTVDTSGSYSSPTVNSNGLGSPPFASIDTVVYIGGSQIQATAIDVTFDNQRSLLGVLGRNTSVDVYEGTLKVTGTLTSLTSTGSLAQFFENETVQNQLTLTMRELGSDNFLSITFYKVKFTSQDIDPPQSGPVLQVLNFEALQESFSGTGTNVFKQVCHIQRRST